jgi:hypothetical protein
MKNNELLKKYAGICHQEMGIQSQGNRNPSST